MLMHLRLLGLFKRRVELRLVPAFARDLRHVLVDHSLSQRSVRRLADVEGGDAPRNADDGDTAIQPDDGRENRQPPAEQDAPHEGHQPRAQNTLLAHHFSRNDVLSKREEGEPRDPEAGKAERNSDDRDKAQHSGQALKGSNPKPAKDEPQQV